VVAEVDFSQTVNLPEVLWTSYCLVGIILYLVLFIMVATEWWRARLEPKHHPDRIVAREQLLLMVLLLLVQCCFLEIGIGALLTPPSRAFPDGTISPLGLTLATGIPLAETFVIAAGTVMLWTRYVLRKETDRVMRLCVDSVYEACPYRDGARAIMAEKLAREARKEGGNNT
jgi:hypothetical protein